MSCFLTPAHCGPNTCFRDCSCYPTSYCTAETAANVGAIVAAIVPVLLTICVVLIIVRCVIKRRRMARRAQTTRTMNFNHINQNIKIEPEPIYPSPYSQRPVCVDYGMMEDQPYPQGYNPGGYNMGGGYVQVNNNSMQFAHVQPGFQNYQNNVYGRPGEFHGYVVQ